EREEEQCEDDADGDGQDDREALAGALQVFELAAPVHRVSRRQRHGRSELALGLAHEAALVASPNVGAHGDLADILATRDDAFATSRQVSGESGMRPPSCVGTRMLLIALASARAAAW